MEGKQLIISVGREFGSGGHQVGELLARRFDLPLYNKNILEEIASLKNIDEKSLSKYDELPKIPFLSRTVRGHSNSPEIHVAEMQFKYLRDKAESGQSFVIVGRCAETVLKDYEGLVSVFVLADEEFKIGRVMDRDGVSRSEALSRMKYYDRKRKNYHNHYCDIKWGDSRNYELSINSSYLDIEGTADVIQKYILVKRDKSKNK